VNPVSIGNHPGGALALINEVIDGLPQNIAVVDAQGRIAAVNRAWRAFALANGHINERECGPGADYLEVCRSAAERGSSDAALVSTRLQMLLSGQTTEFRLEYECSSPELQRWFTLQARLLTVGFEGALLIHSNSTVSHEARQSMDPGFRGRLAGTCICSSCKRIRVDDANGGWESIEDYLLARDGLRFTHGICPGCAERLYPDLMAELRKPED
jgi:hypothetical protein